MKRRLWRKIARFALLIALGIGIAMGLLAAFQRTIVFPRHMVHPDPDAGEGVADLERHWLNIDGGRIEAWFLPAEGAPDGPRRPAVIFTHGNAELIDQWADELEPYRRLGIHLLLPEYRGYGRSTGSPSQEAITGDLMRWFDWLSARADVDPDRLVIHGRSIGGGAACALARQRRPRALVLQSTFTSLRAMAARFWLPPFLVADPFDNLAAIAEFDGPVLVTHGRRDELVPYEHGRRLAAAARNARFVSYETDHNTFPPGPGFWEDLESFLRDSGVLDAR